jgi:N-acylneuraminate cytidylyltransferase
MIDGKRVLGLIPARGGSKGVPGKNIRPLGGKPLIAWTIDAAKGCGAIDRLVLSSDDPQIIRVATQHGCEAPFVRSAELASDTAPTMDVVLDALERCPGFDMVVLLQPTSPLRTSEDISQALDLCVRSHAPACVSVAPAAESPYWMYTLGPRSQMKPLLPVTGFTRRQDLPSVYSLNGAIYVADAGWLKRTRSFLTEETVAYVMPAERSADVDTESDLVQLQFLVGDINHGPLS